MVIGKCTDVFQGDFFGFGGRVEGGGYVGGSFLGEICHGGRKIQGKGRRTNLVTLEKNVKLRA